jgi:hypothetical protein
MSESFSVENNIESEKRPEKLYRGFSVDPESLSLEMLKRDLVPGTVNKEDPTKIGDGNELGVYMSTNGSMVDSTGYSSGGYAGPIIITPRFVDRGAITNMIRLPGCGITVEIDTQDLPIRKPEIRKELQGHYNNGFQGEEWIADRVPAGSYRVVKLKLSVGAHDKELILDVHDFNDEQLLQAINTIKEQFQKKKQEALHFKVFLETLPEKERYNEYTLEKKYQSYKQVSASDV